MFTRIVEIRVQRGKSREVATTIRDKVLPMLRNQPGFVDELVLVSNTEPDHVIGISIWKTQQDAEQYNREQYPKVNEALRHLLETAPTVRTFDVDTSITHKIAAGKAA